MDDIITVAILICVVVGIIIYLYRSKKRGNHCVGCPNAKDCANGCDKTIKK